MTEIATPMAEFLSHLLSLGHLGQDLAEIVRLAEAAFRPSAKYRGSAEERREIERVRKADYRSRVSQKSPGHVPPTLSSIEVTKTQSLKKKERKKESECPVVPRDNVGQDDGWPGNALEQFWREFPPYRRQAKAKVGEKLMRLRKDRKVEWKMLIEGVRKFAATNPGEYAPAPMVWLNDGRWDREYGGLNGQARTNGYRSDTTSGRQPNGADAILAGMGRVASRFVSPEPAAGFKDGGAPGTVDITPGPYPHR